MFAKSQSKRTSSPAALPIAVAVTFSLTLQAFAQSQAGSQAGSAASTSSRSAAATRSATSATTAAASKETKATSASESKTGKPATIYEGDVKTRAGDTTAKAGDTPAKKKKKSKEVEIVKTKLVELTKTTTKDWQTFPSYIELKPGQETLPLTLTIDNGPDETTPMTAIRGDLAGRRLFTEKNFAGKRVLKIDMTNALAPGSTQIIFSTFGAKGSKFSWKLTSNAVPTITKLEGDSITPGKTAKASGSLLPSETNLYTVKVGDKPSSVVSVAENKSVEFKIPQDVKGNEKGEVSIQFTISGQKLKPITAKLVLPPEITSFDYISVNPSLRKPLTISGKNFSKKVSENKVTFNGLPADILSATDTSLTVLVPLTDNVPASQQVGIEVNGLKAQKMGVIWFDMRDCPNEFGSSPFEIGGVWAQ